MRLNVPLYKQSTLYTCGPSSANMVLSYFKKKKPTKEMEFKLWKETMAIPFKIASPYNVANALAKRGLKVILFMKNNSTTKKEIEICFKYENVPKALQNQMFEYYKYYKNLSRIDAKKNRVKFVNKRPDVNVVLEMLKKNYVVIVFSDYYPINKLVLKKKEHIPHIMVIKGFEKDCLIINDPYTKEIKLPIKYFSDLLKTKKYFKMEPSLIVVKA